jgi:lysozyme
MQISSRGLEQLKRSEGFQQKAYQEPDGTWSIGYGHNGVKPDDEITPERGIELLAADVERVGRAVEAQATLPLTQGQYDALVCLGYNIGLGALKNSTLMRKLNAADRAGAADEILRWNKVGGSDHPGLSARALGGAGAIPVVNELPPRPEIGAVIAAGWFAALLDDLHITVKFATDHRTRGPSPLRSWPRPWSSPTPR